MQKFEVGDKVRIRHADSTTRVGMKAYEVTSVVVLSNGLFDSGERKYGYNLTTIPFDLVYVEDALVKEEPPKHIYRLTQVINVEATSPEEARRLAAGMRFETRVEEV